MTSNQKLLIDENLIEDGQTIIIGLSGGPDSVCLLYEVLSLSAVRQKEGGLGNPVVCAHINHGLRGQESDGDEAYVLFLCEKLGLTARIKRADVSVLAKEKSKTIEEAGREVRYAFFDELCEEYFDPVIAVAHNLDDRIETVFMRIVRGTGTDGLTGITAARISAAGFKIVRPLLGVTREEIECRLSDYGETARTDKSNSSTEYFRNKIRAEIFPILEDKLEGNFKNSLLRLSKNAAEDRDYFEIIITDALDEFLQYEMQEGSLFCLFPAEVLALTHPAVRHRIIRAVFSELGLENDIGSVHIAAADRLLLTWQEGGEASGKRVEFPRDFTFGIEKKNAVFRTPETAGLCWKSRRKL